jgi:hypothetical protein
MCQVQVQVQVTSPQVQVQVQVINVQVRVQVQVLWCQVQVTQKTGLKSYSSPSHKSKYYISAVGPKLCEILQEIRQE